MEQHALARPRGNQGKYDDRRRRKATQQPGAPCVGPTSHSGDEHRHHWQPDPRQHKQRLARERGQGVQRPEPKTSGARSLECEGGPAVPGIPRQHGREYQQGNRQSEPGFGCRQPMPVLAARQQVERCPGEGQHCRVFREQGQPGTKARCQPPAEIALLECAQQTQRGPQQRAIERAVRQYPRPGGHAEHRRQAQQYRRPQSCARIRDRGAEPVHQPAGHGEQRDERQAHEDRGLAAEQMSGAPAQPPRCRRMVVIPEAQGTPGRDHVAFVDAEPERRPECDAQSCRSDDQRKQETLCVLLPLPSREGVGGRGRPRSWCGPLPPTPSREGRGRSCSHTPPQKTVAMRRLT